MRALAAGRPELDRAERKENSAETRPTSRPPADVAKNGEALIGNRRGRDVPAPRTRQRTRDISQK